MGFAGVQVLSTLLVVTGALFFDSTKNQLPLAFYILGLPVDGSFSISWAINFGFQLFVLIVNSTFFSAYLSMSMILMNHSCWIIDFAQESANDLGKELDCPGIGLISNGQSELVQEKLKKVVYATCDVIEWQKKAQRFSETEIFQSKRLELSFNINIFRYQCEAVA